MGKKKSQRTKKSKTSQKTPVPASQEVPTPEPVKKPAESHEHIVVHHKAKADDPDNWELKLRDSMDWVQKNGTPLLVGLAIMVAIAGWLMMEGDRKAEAERRVWTDLYGVEKAIAESTTPENRSAHLADTLRVVYERHKGVDGNQTIALALASALLATGDEEKELEAERLLRRLSLGQSSNPRRDLARDMLEKLEQERLRRLQLQRQLGLDMPAEDPGPTMSPVPGDTSN